jgi:hypothetical protein
MFFAQTVTDRQRVYNLRSYSAITMTCVLAVLLQPGGEA